MSMDAKKKPDEDNVVFMPDIYAEDSAVDDPIIEAVVLETPDEDISEGFNPYDTARLFKK